MLLGAASLLLLPVAALSQQKKGMSDLADADWTQMKMTQDQAEEVAKGIFREDIRAGRLTQKQAGEYFRCTEEDYAANFAKNPDAKKYRDALKRMEQLEEMSDAEKAKYDAEMKESAKVMERLHAQSEDKCVKQLGLQIKPGRPLR